jgi:dihydrofolate reductase
MSKTILYMAISADGFIAGPNDETPWSDEEWQAFQQFVKSCDCVLLGRRTYEIMSQNAEFVDGPTYIVVTRDPSFDTGGLQKISIQSREDLPKYDLIGVIGGGELNGSLLKLGLIDEIMLDVEQVNLGSGIKLFGSYTVEPQLELLSTKTIGPKTVQKHYKVVR